jgi:hypothetical protein
MPQLNEYPAFNELNELGISQSVVTVDPVTGMPYSGNTNATSKFRDGFVKASPDLDVWDVEWRNQEGSFMNRGGNSSGSAYLRISMDPFTPNSELVMTSKQMFRLPTRVAFAITASQRMVGQEFEYGLVGCDPETGVVDVEPAIPDMQVVGNIVIASSVATINFATPHPYVGGDRVVLFGSTQSVVNMGPLYVTVVTPTQITVIAPGSVANGTYIGGYVRWADATDRCSNAVSMLAESSSATTKTFVTRRNGASRRVGGVTVGNTAASMLNGSPLTDSFVAYAETELLANMEECQWISRLTDNTATLAGYGKFTNTVPDEERMYKLRIRSKNLVNISRPVAKIVSVTKTGTNATTVTTATPHGLTGSELVAIVGVRDQTNFASHTSQAAITSVINATQFIIGFGAATTATSEGGAVCLIQGGQFIVGYVPTLSVQSIASTVPGILTVTMNTTASSANIGEFWQLYGLTGAASAYEGAYKILRQTGSTYELQYTGAVFASINTGGLLFRRSDWRVHYARMLEYSRYVVELANSRGATDLTKAFPVLVAGGNIAISASSGVGVALQAIGASDVASAAQTSNGNSGAVGTGNYQSAEFVLAITGVGGTSPTFDVSVEESDDGGTNYYKIYDFPRITATGVYRTPLIQLRGRHHRYVYVLGGTSPSFTRTISRNAYAVRGLVMYNYIDRSIVLTTLGSTTPTYIAEGTRAARMTLNIGTATTAPAVQMEGSSNGIDWYNLGAPLQGVASSTVSLLVTDIVSKFTRAKVSTAGAAVVAGYLELKVQE